MLLAPDPGRGGADPAPERPSQVGLVLIAGVVDNFAYLRSRSAAGGGTASAGEGYRFASSSIVAGSLPAGWLSMATPTSAFSALNVTC
jgi:hypothetical protein